MAREKELAKIISNECLAPGIYSMWIECEAAKEATPGQFINVYPNDASKLLPRPISICQIDKSGKLRMVYRVVGKGTEEFSSLKSGDSINILGPLGNGYYGAIKMHESKDADFCIKLTENTRALILGGGIGIPPMLGLAEGLNCKKTIIAGYRSDKELFLMDEIKAAGDFIAATDDGSFGCKGTVIDAVNEKGITADVIFACGPKPMLKGVKELGLKWNVPTYISMEERMACGVGACLGCVCKTNEVDDHSKVNNKRVCVDGPVFVSTEVSL